MPPLITQLKGSDCITQAENRKATQAPPLLLCLRAVPWVKARASRAGPQETKPQSTAAESTSPAIFVPSHSSPPAPSGDGTLQARVALPHPLDVKTKRCVTRDRGDCLVLPIHLGHFNTTGVKVWAVCAYMRVSVFVCLCLFAEEHASKHVPRPGSVQRVCMPETVTNITSTQKTRQVDPHPPHPREHRLAPQFPDERDNAPRVLSAFLKHSKLRLQAAMRRPWCRGGRSRGPELCHSMDMQR